MVHYKLIYFNLRGRGEIIRMVFKHAGVEYEDVRFAKSEWPKIKAGNNKDKYTFLHVTLS